MGKRGGIKSAEAGRSRADPLTGVRAPPDLIALIDSFAEAEGMSRSEAIRRLIELGLAAKPRGRRSIKVRWCAIEVTQLLHQPTLERSIKAVRQRSAGNAPTKAEAHFVWDRSDLLKALQKTIDRKDVPHGITGGPYERYFLVIVTAEWYLTSEVVAEFLRDATFYSRIITDAYLGLKYESDPASGVDSLLVFPLSLFPRA